MTPALLSNYTVFLPQVYHTPISSYELGVQVDNDIHGLEQFVVNNRCYQSPYRWDEPDNWLEYNIQIYKATGNPFIIGTRTCPSEYRLWDRPGSPPRPENYIDFADDMEILVAKYNPWALELWNEPNVTWDAGYEPDLEVQTYDLQTYYGAWIGENETSYQAGLRYGDFCRQVYPCIHDAGTIVLAGAIAGSDVEFLRGMRDANFQADALSFHCYLYEGEPFEKIYTYAALFSQYTDLPLFCTETAVITSYDDAPDSPSLRQRQADYMEFLKNMQNGENVAIDYIQWYGMSGHWRWSGMIKDGIPQPVYEVWKG